MALLIIFAPTFLYEGLCFYLAKAKIVLYFSFLKAKELYLHWQEPILQLLETIVIDGRARELALSARPVQNLEECLAMNSGSEESKRTIECTSQGTCLASNIYYLFVHFLFG